MMTGISTLGQALTQINLLNNQNRTLNNLTTQLSTGKKTQSFKGLSADILTSKRARADVKAFDTYMNNIKGGERRISQMLAAIEEFQKQARSFSNALVQFSQESVHQQGEVIVYDDPLTVEVETTQVGYTSAEPDVDLRTLQDLAGSLYTFMGDLLNVQEGDRYLLGGADSLTRPFTDNGTLDAAISTLITNWKDETLPAATNLTSAELVNALTSRNITQDPNAVTDTIIGYSPALSAGNVGNVFIRVDEKTEVKYTALANEDPFRDILVAASFIKNENLTPIADTFAEPYTPGNPTLADGAPGATLDEMKDNFFQVFNTLIGSVNRAIDDVDSVRFRLETARARIDEIKTRHNIDQNTLLNTIDNVENADMNEVAVQINALQLQIEASYRVAASVSQLSLVNFL
ncbi:MAG: flagellin [Alphaproteobacteria bacterium]